MLLSIFVAFLFLSSDVLSASTYHPNTNTDGSGSLDPDDIVKVILDYFKIDGDSVVGSIAKQSIQGILREILILLNPYINDVNGTDTKVLLDASYNKLRKSAENYIVKSTLDSSPIFSPIKNAVSSVTGGDPVTSVVSALLG